METLADHGNGSYHYIDCIDEAERVLKEKLTANLVPFADNVKVQVEFNPAQVKAYRLIGYENRSLADEDFRDDAVDAGDVGPNSQFTVAYEVVLADSAMKVDEPELKYGGESGATYDNASSDWLTCTMRYHDFDSDKMMEQELAVDEGATMADPSDDWRFAAAVIEFGMLARGSDFAGTSSVDGILDLLGTNLSDERDGFKRLVVKAG
jgi:Ca-activated chloride channel family protein